jgi:phosphatidate cytidylyltransferase
MLGKRIISSVWIAALVITAAWFGNPWFTILISIAGIIAVLEFYGMISEMEVRPLVYFGAVFTIIFILSRNQELQLFISPLFNISLVTPILVIFAISIPIIWLLFKHADREETLNRWLWTIAGIFYVGWLLSLSVALRSFEYGRSWVLFVIIITFASDTAAFFVGRKFGKNKLAPGISPGKTWEGAIGGVIFAVVASLLFILSTPLSLPLTYGQVIFLAVLASIVGQLGDLFESFIKRLTGVKDSSTLIPGHGGVLDRLDSIMFAGLAVYCFVLLTSA